MHLVMDIALISIIMFSVFSNFYGLPGNSILALSSLVYGLITGFESFSFSFVLTLFGIVVALELLEFLLIYFTAKKYGSSKWGISGAIIGGIVGAISGAFVTPIMGAIIGSICGVFLGAFLLEFINTTNVKDSLFSGLGAFLGKLGGLSIKVIGAVTMAVMVASRII
ncbi:MAG: DUF456 domain-containing protein [Calditrichales bacterium]|nr:DUF456 domain-containing protein [Calditrichales bacterium]